MESIQGFLLINLYAFLLIVSTSIIFFSKKRLNQFEDKTYARFLITNIFISLTGLVLGFLVNPDIPVPEFIVIIFNKFYLVSLLLWITTLTLYTFYVSFKNKNKFEKTRTIFKYLDIVNILFVIIFPMKIDMVGSSALPSGLAIIYTYSVFCIGFLAQIICVLINFKNIKNKKYVPIYLLVTLGSVVVINQIINPEMNYLLNPLFIFISVIMYHTIENPDIKLLSEVYKNKELVEQTYEDKSNFLFELTGEVRNPLFNINNICNKIKDEKDINKIKEGLKEIENIARQLDFIVNDVLNVSNLSVQKIKFVDNRYNVNYLFDELVTKINSCKGENVEFRSSISHNIPYLYGDSLKIKQILLSLLLNAVKKTEKGFIEFNIDTIDRFDVCRLIFTIKDSGSGISIEKINEILAATGELNQEDIENMEKADLNMKLCQKVVKLMGGSLMIKSQVGRGTEVLLVIDQRVHIANAKENPLNQIAANTSLNHNVLIICQEKELFNLIKKKLNDKNISFSHVLYGLDAVDKIKRGKKYDYIIVEDEMKEMSGYTTLKELEKLEKFNIPVIVMLNKNKEKIKEHYINDGFKDYLLLDDFSKELERIINKY